MMGGPPPGGRRVDLHTHTTFSDGTLTPAELVTRGMELGLAAIAITDHDSMDGVEPARAAAGSRIEVVPGIEVSTSQNGAEMHVLGYFLDSEHPALRDRLTQFRDERRRRVHAMAERLGAAGVPVDADEVIHRAGAGVVGRPHVAEALVRAGHVASMDDAFRRYLGPSGLAYVPRPQFRPESAIAMIHAAGGVSVLAHPGAALPDLVIETLAQHGLRGIEVWHPQHPPAVVRRYQALAARLGLVTTGGSDYHGPGRGADLGDRPVPARVLETLKRAAGVAG